MGRLLRPDDWWPGWLTPIGVVWETWRGMSWAMTGAWLLMRRGDWLVAGILIGLVVAIKPNYALVPLVLFAAGHWRPAFTAGAAAGQGWALWTRLVSTERTQELRAAQASTRETSSVLPGRTSSSTWMSGEIRRPVSSWSMAQGGRLGRQVKC